MKDKWFMCFVLLLVFSFVSTELFSQSSSNDQGLVGTWIAEEEEEFSMTFNTNGSFSNSFGHTGEWNIDGNKIIITLQGEMQPPLEYLISQDGRELVIYVNEFGDSRKYRKET